MEYVRLGQSGLQVSRLALGTMTFGSQLAEGAAHSLLDQAYAAGINFFDSAEMYAAPAQADTHGISERILGSWIKTKPRESVIVSTKVAGASDRPEGPRLSWIRGGYTTLDRFHFTTACEASLRRLGTDYIDLYQPHWPDRVVPIDEQLEAVDRLIASGKIRYYGLSNDTAWGVTRQCAHADLHGLPRPISLQGAYNLLQRSAEHGLAEVCTRETAGFIAFSPLAMGVLTGKYSGGKRPADARLSKFGRYGEMYLKDQMVAVADRYVAIARESGLPPAQMAYAWVRQQPFVTATLSSFSDEDQFAPFIASASLSLNSEILTKLESIRQTHDARWNQFG